jgi:two-component system, NarL family, nitrate/nitrite response regulator NarL
MRLFKVLVVDDFEAFRQVVCSMLQEAARFCVVGQACDGLEAVQKAEEYQPDVILLDVGLPKLNGIEAARQISVVAPQSRVLFLSQNADPTIVHSALSNGAYGYVLKSDGMEQLFLALATVVRGEKFLSSGLALVEQA